MLFANPAIPPANPFKLLMFVFLTLHFVISLPLLHADAVIPPTSAVSELVDIFEFNTLHSVILLVPKPAIPAALEFDVIVTLSTSIFLISDVDKEFPITPPTSEELLVPLTVVFVTFPDTVTNFPNPNIPPTCPFPVILELFFTLEFVILICFITSSLFVVGAE